MHFILSFAVIKTIMYRVNNPENHNKTIVKKCAKVIGATVIAAAATGMIAHIGHREQHSALSSDRPIIKTSASKLAATEETPASLVTSTLESLDPFSSQNMQVVSIVAGSAVLTGLALTRAKTQHTNLVEQTPWESGLKPWLTDEVIWRVSPVDSTDVPGGAFEVVDQVFSEHWYPYSQEALERGVAYQRPEPYVVYQGMLGNTYWHVDPELQELQRIDFYSDVA